MAVSAQVYIVAACRSPIGAYNGQLSTLKSTEIGSQVLSHALNKIKLSPESVDEVIIGCALPAGLGQNPAQSVATLADVPASKTFTTVNKVCASGMKAISLGAQQIQLSLADIVVVGGIESMSNAPNYVPKKAVTGQTAPQDVVPVDGMITDGLSDAKNGTIMGIYAEECAITENISRKEQDDYAIRSYELSKKAVESYRFDNEIAPIITKLDNTKPVTNDEIRKLDVERMRACKPAFVKETGTVTGPNSSSISDGAACLILASEFALKKHNLTPVALIKGYADAGNDNPAMFTIAPTNAVNKCLKICDVSLDEIDYFEINEAFSVVALANQRRLGISMEKLNIFGGAVSLGHPIGCSGARIVVTLVNILHSTNKKMGCAAICNGGGGASAMIIEAVYPTEGCP